MEYFERSAQHVLDRYVSGSIDETELLREVGWEDGWGFDYHLYRPLMVLARQNGTRILAINAPREIVSKVARKGLQSLSTEERSRLAREIHLDNEADRRSLLEIFGQHAGGSLERFEYFYQAQCVWEDTMAETVADYVEDNGGTVVVLTGNGHISRVFSTPHRTRERIAGGVSAMALYPLTGHQFIARTQADYIWLTRR
jgi:uncharacterized iron-regulated protein